MEKRVVIIGLFVLLFVVSVFFSNSFLVAISGNAVLSEQGNISYSNYSDFSNISENESLSNSSEIDDNLFIEDNISNPSLGADGSFTGFYSEINNMTIENNLSEESNESDEIAVVGVNEIGRNSSSGENLTGGFNVTDTSYDVSNSSNESAFFEENIMFNESDSSENNSIDGEFIVGVKVDEKKFFGLISKTEQEIEGDKLEKKQEIIGQVGRIADLSSGEFATELNESEKHELEKRDDIDYIEPVRNFEISLTEAVPLIDANNTWTLMINDTNLTGNMETVCIIDTGINFNHVDLIGKNKTCNIYCNPDGSDCIENCSVTDLNGHGTHVAGIVGANGRLKGVAPGVSLIGVKVFSGSSSSDATTLSIRKAIDWCVANSDNYNISVISMSLGTSTAYSDYCDGEFPSFNNSINSAFVKNISVVVSSGNDANYTAISSPACIPNAIPVADVYDANVGGLTWVGTCTDSTTTEDKIVCHANRNSLVKLLAPGAMINSTWYDGGYANEGGTSMAAPMVAGAIAIINQMLNQTNQSKTPLEIEAVLNQTGKIIYDSFSGLSYSRINVYDSVINLDNISPNVTLIEPENGGVVSGDNINFSCSATDMQLKNLSFYLWNSSDLIYNSSVDVSGASNSSIFNYTLDFGNYKWNCLAYDLNGNSAFADNYTLSRGGVLVSLISPENSSTTEVNETNFTCDVSTEQIYELINLSFYLWNSSDLIYNSSVDVSGASNSSIFNYTLDEGTYFWTCDSFNNVSNYSIADNYTLSYEVPEVVVPQTSPSTTPSSGGSGGGAVSIVRPANLSNNTNQTNIADANQSEGLTLEERNATFETHENQTSVSKDSLNLFKKESLFVIAIVLIVIGLIIRVTRRRKNKEIEAEVEVPLIQSKKQRKNGKKKINKRKWKK